jgi:hypothetical protein
VIGLVSIAYIWGMYRFEYGLRLLLWWLAVVMPLGAYAGDEDWGVKNLLINDMPKYYFDNK